MAALADTARPGWRVAVFGASSRMGQAQVRELRRRGLVPRAVTRQAHVFADAGIDGLDVQPADFDDPATLDTVMAGMDAVLFQAPSFGEPPDVRRQCANVRDAALRAGIARFVFNTTTWIPDDPPCGEPWYDHMRGVEDMLTNSALPLTVVRPVLLMDNLLTLFARPALVEEGVFRYCHPPGMRASWIASEDIARFMVEALFRPDLIGEKLTLGGPEVIRTEELCAILTRALGKPIRHEYVPPRAFGELMYPKVGDLFADGTAFADHFDSFYGFNISSPLRPFEVDMAPLLARMPIAMVRLEDWATRQDWRHAAAVGSTSG